MLSGEKRVTIRKGWRDFEDEIEIEGHKVVVDEVIHRNLNTIAFIDLIEDGFRNWKDVVESLKRFYPDISPETQMTVVHFHLKDQD